MLCEHVCESTQTELVCRRVISASSIPMSEHAHAENQAPRPVTLRRRRPLFRNGQAALLKRPAHRLGRAFRAGSRRELPARAALKYELPQASKMPASELPLAENEGRPVGCRKPRTREMISSPRTYGRATVCVTRHPGRRAPERRNDGGNE